MGPDLKPGPGIAAVVVAAAAIALGDSVPGAHAATTVPVPAGGVAVLGGATLRAWAPALFEKLDPWTATNLPLINADYYTCTTDCSPRVIDYPRAAGPLFGPGSPDADETIEMGAAELLKYVQDAQRPTVIAGLSLGSIVSDEVQRLLAADPSRPPAQRLSFVVASDPSRVTPLSTAVGSFFPIGLRMPILRWTVTRPPESNYDVVAVVGEYDLIGDFPDRPWNLLAAINSVAGFFTVHSEVSLSNPKNVPPQNISVTTNPMGGTTTTYLVPTPVVPLLKPFEKVLTPQVAEAANNLLKPIVDRGYSRNDGRTGNREPFLRPTSGWPDLVRPAQVAASPERRRGDAACTRPAPARSEPRR